MVCVMHAEPLPKLGRMIANNTIEIDQFGIYIGQDGGRRCDREKGRTTSKERFDEARIAFGQRKRFRLKQPTLPSSPL
jgi:hypothetical protein